MKVVVTGAAGFIGSNFVHYLVEQRPEWSVVALDALTYAGNLRNLEDVLETGGRRGRATRCEFIRLDICDPKINDAIAAADAVVHFAAESHVDRSIDDASAFIRTNVEGTWRVVEACRAARVRRLVHVSTDEVYGSLGPAGRFTETTPLDPTSPYSASKAASDLVVLAYTKTHRLPAIVTRCSNNYGPYQFPEKFIPLMIAQALDNQPLPVYGDGRNVRDWIFVRDHCSALLAILERGTDGEVYNIGGENELANIDVVHKILELTERPRSLVRFVKDRPAHDRRYAMDCAKIKNALGWKPSMDFEQGLKETVQWYRENREWLENVRSGAYLEYFERHYARRQGFEQPAAR
jgi:dTDP-glucose 4,6-dehydratase